MPSVVTIQIKIDNSGALPPIKQIEEGLASAGVQGEVSMQRASSGIQTMSGHAATSLDSVRLLSQEFGLRLPRAIESMISRVPGITSGLSSVLGIMAGIAAAQVFLHVGEEIYGAYEKYISLNAAADHYYDTLKKTREADFGAPRDIETQQARFTQATATAFQKQQDAIALRQKSLYDLNPVTGVADFFHARTLADQGATAMGQRDQVSRAGLDLNHQRVLDQIELNHALDSTKGKEGEIQAARQKAHDINAENRKYNRASELAAGNPAPETAGSEEERLKNQQADAEASAKEINLSRSERDARITMQNEAIDAGLDGEQKLLAVRQQAIDAIVRKFHDGEISRQTEIIETAAISQKFDNERDARLQKQFQDAQQAMRTARQSGLTGAARIYADQGNEIDRNNSNRAIDPEARHQLNIAAATTANQKLKELDDNFTTSTKQLIDQRTADQLGGFARIDAEAQRSIAERQKQYDAAYKDDQGRDTATPQQHQMMVDSIAAIDSDAAAKRTELQQRNNAEDLQYAQEATRAEQRIREDGVMGWVAAYQNGLVEIRAQEQERMARLDADAVKEGLTAQQVAQRRADIEREASAEVAQQNQQLQHQIASNLQSAFTDPIGYIKSRMQQMFFEILAQWLVQSQMFKTLFGNTMSTLSPGARGTSGAAGTVGAATNTGGLLGGLIPGMRGITNGSPNISSIYAPDTTANNSGTGGGAITAVDSGTLALARVAHGSGTVSQTGAILNTSTAGRRVDLSGGGAGTLSMPQLPGSGGGISSTAHASGASNGALALPQIPGISGGVAAPAHASSASGAISDVGSALSTAQRSGILRSSSTGGVDLTGSAGGFNTNGATAPGVTDSGDNGEGGGFAGSITGNTDDMSMAAAQRSADVDPTGSGGGINAQASQQAAAANAPAAGGASLTSSIGKLAPVAMAGYSIESSTVNAFETNNPLKGALADAAAGAEIGTVFGGPIGTAIGAAAGAALGAASGLVGMATGEGSKMMARTYYEQTVQPQLEQIYNGAGSGDFQSEIASANSIASDAKAYMSTKFGIGAADWIDSNYMQKELLRVTQLISNTAEGGRQYVTLSAAQFHSGGLISGFGSLGTSSNEGYIHALLGETVMNPSASSTHAPMLSAMNSGASASDIASAYLASSSGASTSSGSTDNSTHFHIHTMDPKNMDHWLQTGGAQQISKAQNNFSGQYAGDGISG